MNENNTTPADLIDRARTAIKIDELNLDKECLRLPKDFLSFALLAADERRAVEETKAALDVVEADIAKEVRANPQSFGLEKVTESAVSSAVTTNPRYQKALTRLQSARQRQDIAQAVVTALDCKKRSLTMLVELHGMSYFASPSLSERGRKVVEEQTRENVRPRRRAMDDDK